MLVGKFILLSAAAFALVSPILAPSGVPPDQPQPLDILEQQRKSRVPRQPEICGDSETKFTWKGGSLRVFCPNAAFANP